MVQDFTDSAAEDVLEKHHAKNRRPRPPNPDQLNRIRNASVRKEEEESDDGNDSETIGPQRAGRYSKTPRSEIEAKPTQLNFYPGNWRDLLEFAKRIFRRWLACENGFPTRRLKLPPEAGECVAEALAEHRDKGGVVEPGKYMLCNILQALIAVFPHRLLEVA